jgi:hypothetical protein
LKTGERYTLTLDALADDAPAAVRLRALLKYALRACRLRAVEVLDGDGAASADEVRRLRQTVEGLARRVAEQAELLSRRTERPAAPAPRT